MGTVRFFLAMSVVAFHLSAQLPSIGILAVNFFYVISGFLITLVLHESYRFEFGPFALNRVLRLYPAYLICALSAVVLHAAFPASLTFHPIWLNELQPGDLWANLFVLPWAFLGDKAVEMNTFGLPFLNSSADRFRLITPSWSIAVELVCYMILWAFTGRNIRSALITLAVAIFWHLAAQFYFGRAGWRYYPIVAALLPFSLGALAYFLRPLMPKVRNSALLAGIVAASIFIFTANWWADFPSTRSSISYFTNYGIAFVSVLAIGESRFPGLLGKIDRFLGDLSYPAFLSHYVAAGFAFQFMPAGTPIRGWLIFAIGAIATLTMSAAIVLLVDRRLVGLRGRVRPSGEFAMPSLSAALRKPQRTEVV